MFNNSFNLKTRHVIDELFNTIIKISISSMSSGFFLRYVSIILKFTHNSEKLLKRKRIEKLLEASGIVSCWWCSKWGLKTPHEQIQKLYIKNVLEFIYPHINCLPTLCETRGFIFLVY